MNTDAGDEYELNHRDTEDTEIMPRKIKTRKLGGEN
jgi:hypothetical protein